MNIDIIPETAPDRGQQCIFTSQRTRHASESHLLQELVNIKEPPIGAWSEAEMEGDSDDTFPSDESNSTIFSTSVTENISQVDSPMDCTNDQMQVNLDSALDTEHASAPSRGHPGPGKRGNNKASLKKKAKSQLPKPKKLE